MDPYGVIRQAILEQRRVGASYRGRHRELCPHAIGLKNGLPRALFYQCGGESSSGLSPDPSQNWRCMDIDELSEVHIIDGEWASAVNYSQPTNCIDTIDVAVPE